MATRRASSMAYEGWRAMLSVAGVRPILQDNVSVGATSNQTYTVSSPGTRRVICFHLAANAGDIRFNMDAAATGSHLPVLPQRYFIVDAEKDQVLNFYNTSGTPVTVYLMEIE